MKNILENSPNTIWYIPTPPSRSGPFSRVTKSRATKCFHLSNYHTRFLHVAAVACPQTALSHFLGDGLGKMRCNHRFFNSGIMRRSLKNNAPVSLYAGSWNNTSGLRKKKESASMKITSRKLDRRIAKGLPAQPVSVHPSSFTICLRSRVVTPGSDSRSARDSSLRSSSPRYMTSIGRYILVAG